MDQPAGGGGGAERLGAGGLGPGAARHQRGPGGAPPHCWRGGYCGPRGYTHQLQGREAAHASTGLFPRGPAGSHLCRLQHVRGCPHPQSGCLLHHHSSIRPQLGKW